MQEREVIDVRVKSIGKVGPFLAKGMTLTRGLQCVVQTERGIELGVVVRERHLISTSESSPSLNVAIEKCKVCSHRSVAVLPLMKGFVATQQIWRVDA